MTNNTELEAAIEYAERRLTQRMKMLEGETISDEDIIQITVRMEKFAALITAAKEVDGLRQRVADLEAKMPEVVTVERISQHIQTWRFDDDIDGAFGAYLMKKYPNGVLIVKEGE